jgi:hypothetical protein
VGEIYSWIINYGTRCALATVALNNYRIQYVVALLFQAFLRIAVLFRLGVFLGSDRVLINAHVALGLLTAHNAWLFPQSPSPPLFSLRGSLYIFIDAFTHLRAIIGPSSPVTTTSLSPLSPPSSPQCRRSESCHIVQRFFCNFQS